MKPHRFVSWWITWRDLNWPDPDNYDRIRRRADALAESCATGVYTFGTHFRWDWLPYFDLLHDYMATVAQELHERNMIIIDHHSVELVHRYRTREDVIYMMKNSGPHLPLGPSFDAASTWTFHGRKLNDWRSIDVTTGEVLYYPQYQSEGFCHRNPEFIESYCEYAKKLLADTGIDGIEPDDSLHFARFRSCGCKYCRAALLERSGIELPPADDKSFWGNWDNPAFRDWIDIRLESTSIFQTALNKVLPPGFPQASCCPGSYGFGGVACGCDATEFIKGCTWQNLELSGNVPPYKADKLTGNPDIIKHLINASYNSGAARTKNARCVGGGYAFYEAPGNILWAAARCLGADCWSSTLKGRLGLPTSVIDAKLPDDAIPPRRSFQFEAAHEDLFDTKEILQCGVYFSKLTHRHHCIGSLSKGYSKDFEDTLRLLIANGIAVGTLHEIPLDTKEVPVVVIPGAAIISGEELERIKKFTAAGGYVIACGFSGLPGAVSAWQLPRQCEGNFWERLKTERDISPGITYEWQYKWIEEPSQQGAKWQTLGQNLIYNPQRPGDENFAPELLAEVNKHLAKRPFDVKCDGYFVFIRRGSGKFVVQLLAAEYNTDVNHELEDQRKHRTRVNLINFVEPIKISRTVEVSSVKLGKIYAPFNDEEVQIELKDGKSMLLLPEKCSYIVFEVED